MLLSTKQELVKKTFNNQNCILLSKYKNDHAELKYFCKCGNLSDKKFAEFEKNSKCPKCEVIVKNDIRMLKKRYLNIPSRTVASQYNTLQKVAEVLGYTFEEWLAHYEKFEDYHNGNWHNDHIFPIKAFTDFGICSLKYPHVVSSLVNIMPLNESKNHSKGGQYDVQTFKDCLDKNFPEVKYTIPEHLQVKDNQI